ncbi:MAG: nodulation protein NodH [Rhodobacteraceae bacterium]|nr:nodulation protein NodH [Paracoccaceae bacterium]
MRTGSNLLEATLNSFSGLACHGEAFNPTFVGHKNKTDLFGVTLDAREADPVLLIRRMIEQSDGLPGFRFFHDHDPRVLVHCLEDRRCAKLILTRNPLESFVSLKIAGQTGQWKLGDLKNQKTARARFDAADFERHLTAVQGFQLLVQHALQTTAQTAFYIDYEDLHDLDVLNGLARFLGVEARIDAIPDALKKQNPEEIRDKVVNPDEMELALEGLDRFNLSRTPNFEPRRGPGVPSLVAAKGAPLLFMPIKGGPEARVTAWLAGIGGGLTEGFTHKALRQWRRSQPNHRSFTVLRHPLARAHAAFCETLASGRPAELRFALRRLYKVHLPADPADPAYDLYAHRTAFLAFLKFLKGNLSAQTSVKVDPAWATQTAVLQGFATITGPDLVLREDQLAPGLAFLASEVGLPALAPGPELPTGRYALADVFDDEIEAAAREAYQRDYATFGFGAWRP